MTSRVLEGRTALVTGGTRGFGLAVGTELSRAGAAVYLTHRWGSVPDSDVVEAFRRVDAPEPCIVECDVSDAEANRELMEKIKAATGAFDIVISNVAFSQVIQDVNKLRKKSLDLSVGYSAWPVVDLVQAAHQVFERFPRYVIGVSSDGAEVCHPGYDFAGTSKAVLETLCRYLALRLKPEGVRVNAIRPGFLDTASSRATFGDEAVERLRGEFPGLFLDPQRVARTCVALSSGWMDSVTGQVITVDEGWSLVSPMSLVTGDGVPRPFPEEDPSS